MNVYVVVEGVGEKKVYADWIPLVNTNLALARTISEVENNNFYIASGGGYPNIFEVIEAAIDDMCSIKKNGFYVFDRLVVGLDSEDETLTAKYDEIETFILDIARSKNINIDYKIIIQHFCLEAWALGNSKVTSSNNIRDPELLAFKQIFDVGLLDPELLPSRPDLNLNRSQFALKYLTKLLNNKFRNHTYSKKDPSVILHPKYFDQIKNRCTSTDHIQSFNAFLNAFA